MGKSYRIKIRKESLLFALVGFLSGSLIDSPRHLVPSQWQNGLGANSGQFVIRRDGDITLRYVNAPLGSGDLELVPVPFYQDKGPRTESVREIARRFGVETRRTVLAAINGGFFDTASGLPIGFLMRDRKMEFFNMPQGFTRSMVGFGPVARHGSGSSVYISSPRQMPKVWIDTQSAGAGRPTRTAKVAVHHINIPGGKNALSLFTPTFGKRLTLPAKAIYAVALEEPAHNGVYRVVRQVTEGTIHIPPEGLIVAMHGDSVGRAGLFPIGTLVRPAWSLPQEWTRKEVTHGLLAGPRLLEHGNVQVTAKEERLDKLKSRDRVALGVKANGETVLLWAHKNTPGDLSFTKLAELLIALGAQEAIALDGGRSRAILAQQGGAFADQRYFEGGRPVANALVLAVRATKPT